MPNLRKAIETIENTVSDLYTVLYGGGALKKPMIKSYTFKNRKLWKRYGVSRYIGIGMHTTVYFDAKINMYCIRRSVFSLEEFVWLTKDQLLSNIVEQYNSNFKLATQYAKDEYDAERMANLQ